MLRIFFGPPGCGKGTQAKLLADNLGVKHVNVGDVIREFAKKNPEHECSDILASGKLLPDEFINQIVLKEILGLQDCILDGFPRSVKQAEFLISNLKCKMTLVVFDAQEDALLKRIEGRYSCSQCKKLYNKNSVNPKIEGICDECGCREFFNRDDDKVDVFKVRIAEYNRFTLPVVRFLESRINMVVNISALKTIQEVYNELSSKLS